MKTFAFWAIVVCVSAVTLYILATTISSHVISYTRGPVHWHADFEIWACDQFIEIPESKFPRNKVGTALIHHHNDHRIHVEGIVEEKNAVILKNVLAPTGIIMEKDSITVPLKSGGAKTWKNKDECIKGKKGKWHLFVNGKPSQEWGDHMIAPETSVPPGDRLKFIFSEKPAGKLDPFIERERQ